MIACYLLVGFRFQLSSVSVSDSALDASVASTALDASGEPGGG